MGIGMTVERRIRFLIVMLTLAAIVGATTLLRFHVPNPFLVIGTLLACLAGLFFLIRSGLPVRQKSKDPNRPAVHFKAGIVFLLGAILGTWHLIVTGWHAIDLVYLVLPIALATWFIGDGFRAIHRKSRQG